MTRNLLLLITIIGGIAHARQPPQAQTPPPTDPPDLHTTMYTSSEVLQASSANTMQGAHPITLSTPPANKPMQLFGPPPGSVGIQDDASHYPARASFEVGAGAFQFKHAASTTPSHPPHQQSVYTSQNLNKSDPDYMQQLLDVFWQLKRNSPPPAATQPIAAPESATPVSGFVKRDGWRFTLDGAPFFAAGTNAYGIACQVGLCFVGGEAVHHHQGDHVYTITTYGNAYTLSSTQTTHSPFTHTTHTPPLTTPHSPQQEAWTEDQIISTLNFHAQRGVTVLRIWAFADGYGEYEQWKRPFPFQATVCVWGGVVFVVWRVVLLFEICCFCLRYVVFVVEGYVVAQCVLHHTTHKTPIQQYTSTHTHHITPHPPSNHPPPFIHHPLPTPTPTPSHTQPGQYIEANIQRLDFVLHYGARVGLRFTLALVNSWPDFGGRLWYVRSLIGPQASEDEFYTSQATRDAYKQWVCCVCFVRVWGSLGMLCCGGWNTMMVSGIMSCCMHELFLPQYASLITTAILFKLPLLFLPNLHTYTHISIHTHIQTHKHR